MTCVRTGRLLRFEEQRSNFRWWCANDWKLCLVWFWISCNHSLQPNRSQMKCDIWKPCSDQRWQTKLQFLIWRFSEQFFFVNNHLQCYWPTIHNSISKICPKFQLLGSNSLEVDEHHELLDEKWAKIVLTENISTSIHVECDKMYWSKVCVHRRSIILVLRAWPWYSTRAILDRQFCMQKKVVTVAGCKTLQVIWQVIYWFFQQTVTNQRLSGQGESQRVRQLGFNCCWVLKFSAAPRPFCVALSLSVHWHVPFLFCCYHYDYFFLGFRQWQSRADRVLTLNL